jgi:predicted nucleic acid-binding protein
MVARREVVGLVLDTSVVIDLLRGEIADESVLDAAREPVMISTMTIHEVLFGLKDGEAALTDAILSSFAIVPVGAAEAELSAYWRRKYRSEGLSLKLADTAIAATAAIRNVPLATGNVKDFPMPELQIEQWRVGA